MIERRSLFNFQKEFNLSPRVVIAEDDWLNRDLLENYLHSAGCKVNAYADGLTAWEAIRNNPPDMALLDIQMPQLDGLTVCRWIKNEKDLGFVPVIMVTALNSEEEKTKALEAGADDFIGKPYSSVALLSRINSLLRIKKLHQELEDRNRLLRSVLNRFLDKDIAEVILEDPEKHLKLGGDTRRITVLFADIRGFTSFSEAHSAEMMVKTLNQLFSALTDVINANGGTFDKYMGDSLMAFYGAPFKEEDDTKRALTAAIQMRERFAEIQSQDPVLAELRGLGVGIHVGEATVGNIGSEHLMDYTAIGDTVNVSKRLQEIAQPGEILITEDVLTEVPSLEVELKSAQRLSGKRELVSVYKLLGCG